MQWYESLPNYINASPSQQALFRSLPLDQQIMLASATPQEVAYMGGNSGSGGGGGGGGTGTNPDDIYMGGGYGYIDPIMQYMTNWLQQQGMAGQAAGYVPGGYLGMEGVLPTLSREQARADAIMNLAQIQGNPRDWGQLRNVFALSDTASPISAAASQGMDFTGDDWDALINNLVSLIPAAGAAPTGTATPTAPAAPASQWYEELPSYQGSSSSQQNLYRNLPVEQQRALATIDTPEERSAFDAYIRALTPQAMAGGGKMTIDEPSGIFGLLSGQLRATLGEVGPEKVTVTPEVKGFADGGTVNVNPDRYQSPVSGKYFRSKQGYDTQMGKNANARATWDKLKSRDPATISRVGAGISRAFHGVSAEGLRNLQESLRNNPPPPTGGDGGTTPPTTTPDGTGDTVPPSASAAPQFSQMAPTTQAALMAMLGQGQVPTPSNMNYHLYQQLAPSVIEYLMGSSGVSGAGVEPTDWISEMLKFRHAAPQSAGYGQGYFR